ncbi:MAG: asparagine synthase (glutamine-hydrolyzing) [Candidatus Promineifilaceae bacterium]
MCGIAGFVSAEITPSTIERMTTAIAHRGPDDSGGRHWSDHGVAIGQRRLAIIDLSPAGHNPMPNETGDVWITFNGEIYNFQALRTELQAAGHNFRSNTDTEVILHAYEEWGDEHVQRLRGMFAYAIYDRREAEPRLLLVRDRLGIKPLHYAWEDNNLLFASELKGILAADRVSTSVNRSAIWEYLTYGYIPAPKTIYQSIHKLPAAHLLVYERQQITIRRYWELPAVEARSVSLPEAIEQLDEQLKEAVKLHLISDVPLGVFLSGGVDSSAMTAYTSAVSAEKIHTFSIGFDVAAHSEIEYARQVAQQYDTVHTEYTVGAGDVQTMLPRVVTMYDEPFADGSAVPTFFLSQQTRQSATVAISGDGGDELFWGYRWFDSWLKHKGIRLPTQLNRALPLLAGKVRWQQRLQKLTRNELERYGWHKSVFLPLEKHNLLSPQWQRQFKRTDDFDYLRQHWREDLDPITRIQHLEMQTYLVGDILTKVDRASMAVGLEVRPPLLDHVLIESVMRLQANVRVPQQELKGLLKRAVKDKLSNEILYRPKKGFSAPYTRWLNDERGWVRDFLNNGAAVAKGILAPNPVDKIDASYGGSRLWSLLVLEQWLRTRS